MSGARDRRYTKRSHQSLTYKKMVIILVPLVIAYHCHVKSNRLKYTPVNALFTIQKDR